MGAFYASRYRTNNESYAILMGLLDDAYGAIYLLFFSGDDESNLVAKASYV
jgi:hypothetical protein